VEGTNKAHENGEAMGLVGVRLTDLLGHTRLPAVPRCAKMEPFWLH
jgi:hypothetical protein